MTNQPAHAYGTGTPGQYVAAFTACSVFLVVAFLFVTKVSPARPDAPRSFTVPDVRVADRGSTDADRWSLAAEARADDADGDVASAVSE